MVLFRLLVELPWEMITYWAILPGNVREFSLSKMPAQAGVVFLSFPLLLQSSTAVCCSVQHHESPCKSC